MIRESKNYTLIEAAAECPPITPDQLYDACKNKIIPFIEFTDEPSVLYISGGALLTFKNSEDFEEITRPLDISLTGIDAVEIVKNSKKTDPTPIVLTGNITGPSYEFIEGSTSNGLYDNTYNRHVRIKETIYNVPVECGLACGLKQLLAKNIETI